MPSAAHTKFHTLAAGVQVLASFHGSPSPASANQAFVDEICLKAAVANAVGCWEGYVEGVLREFVSKVRVQAHRRSWTLIAQYEALVDKMAADLNTPNWDKARDLTITVTGMDPYPSWIWAPRFSNQNDTKNFLDGVLKVRHAFAHGFSVPNDVPGLIVPGVLDPTYVADALACLKFFVDKTDHLLEHELTHRHACSSGWN